MEGGDASGADDRTGMPLDADRFEAEATALREALLTLSSIWPIAAVARC